MRTTNCERSRTVRNKVLLVGFLHYNDHKMELVNWSRMEGRALIVS
jgi:hypothetical protein